MAESSVPESNVPTNSDNNVWNQNASNHARNILELLSQAHEHPQNNIVNESNQQDVMPERAHV
jgi:hypothetical protein